MKTINNVTIREIYYKIIKISHITLQHCDNVKSLESLLNFNLMLVLNKQEHWPQELYIDMIFLSKLARLKSFLLRTLKSNGEKNVYENTCITFDVCHVFSSFPPRLKNDSLTMI